MALVTIRTASFRNLENAEVNVSGKDIFLVGENGQGKTNFLEAVYFASYGSTFRGVRDGDLVRNGERDCSVSMKISGSAYNGVSVIYRDGKKSINLDGKRIEDRKELLNVAPCIVFCHEDMEFVAGAPESRRWFFDQTLSLPDPLYLDDLRNYRRALKSRNSLLKNESERGVYGKISAEIASLLDALDPQLVRYGLEIMKKRRTETENFSAILEPLYCEISGLENITINYASSWKDQNEEAVLSELIARRDSDCSFGVTLTGPHRDRYVFNRKNVSGRKSSAEFTGKASTGQRRLLALLLRIAQARIFSGKTGKNPVLLLDDVLLELDGEKRKKFLSLMPGYDQAFYTFLPEEPYNSYRKDDTIIYEVSGGKLKCQT